MPSNGKRNRGRQPYLSGKSTPPQPGDEQVGDWSHSQLVRMDNRFRAASCAHLRGARRTARPQPQRMMQTALT
jgi:hypothetical protein